MAESGTAGDATGSQAAVYIRNRTLASSVRSACLALREEIEASRRAPARTFPVHSGERVDAAGGSCLYRFRADVRLPLQPETPVEFIVDGRSPVTGALVSQEDFCVLLHLGEDIGVVVREAKVNANPSFIYEAARGRLTGFLEPERPGGSVEGSEDSEASRVPPNEPLAMAVLGLNTLPARRDADAAERARQALVALERPSLSPNAAQLAALSACSGSSLHFVWGPPGTGKTACLAQTVRMLASQPGRLAILAHSNVAVDVAMVRVAEAMAGTEELHEGRVLRVGPSQLPEARACDAIQPEAVLARTYPALIDHKRSLEQQRSELSRKVGAASEPDSRRAFSAELHQVRGNLYAVEQQIAELRAALFRNARVLGATLSRFVLSEALFKWPPTTAIVDEVSMATFPLVLAAALQARERLLLFGDFRQLPPIAVSNGSSAAEWCARDAFEIAGVRERIDTAGSDERVTMLDTQYRMAPEIAELVSEFSYGGRLRTDEVAGCRAASMARLAPLSGRGLIMIDSGPLAARCVREPRLGSFSRLNPLHAIVNVAAVMRLATQGASVAAITPYRAQARLIERGLRSLQSDGSLQAATVHRFQGSERDAVVFDVVDSWGMSGASMLTGRDIDMASRLLNVAMSRARGKLLIVGDVEFIETMHPAGSPSRALVERLERDGRIKPATLELLGQSFEADGIKWLDGFREAEPLLQDAITGWPGDVDINLPEGFQPSPELIQRLADAAASGRRTTIFGTVESAARLEETEADVRLLARSAGFFGFVGSHFALVGGGSERTPVAVLSSADFNTALRNACLGESQTLPPPSSEAEALLDREFGRCGECGRNRRPHPRPGVGWVLQCNRSGHTPVPLLPSSLETAVNALKVRCLECRSIAVVHVTEDTLFLACPDSASGCSGRPPSLRELFGSE